MWTCLLPDIGVRPCSLTGRQARGSEGPSLIGLQLPRPSRVTFITFHASMIPSLFWGLSYKKAGVIANKSRIFAPLQNSVT